MSNNGWGRTKKDLSEKAKIIREHAENSLEAFIRLVAPHRVIPHVHSDLISWWTREGALSHQLCLLPRDHGKSAMVAYRVLHHIVKNPDTRVLYISNTAGIAEKQLKFIKDVLTSKIFMDYWPEYVHPEEGKRAKWTTTEIEIDHIKRKEEGVRDPTILTGGLTTSLTGYHCDVIVMDDVVVRENAYTGEGRRTVEQQYSLLSSIEGAEGQQWVVGTHYHPKDLYSVMKEMQEEVFNEHGEVIDKRNVYEVFERKVEDKGDGTGQFLWPRQRRSDGKWFGFDREILAKKRAQYLDKTQFRAQYYNDPNDASESPIQKEMFQYYEPKFLSRSMGHWYYKDKRLNVVAAVDFAFSTKQKADFTSIVVVGIDRDQNIYVLDIERFKTDKISTYYDYILNTHIKWGYRKLRAECSVAQSVIIKELKDNYLRPNGLSIAIEEFRPTRTQGSKEERINIVLQPKYNDQRIWHYRGGHCEMLEEELVLQNPAHDDIKDALSSAVEIAIPPIGMLQKGLSSLQRTLTNGNKAGTLVYNSRFGGVAH